MPPAIILNVDDNEPHRYARHRVLVEAGFTPEQAIQIYTQNGAKFLGREDRIGTIAAGKQAGVIEGRPGRTV